MSKKFIVFGLFVFICLSGIVLAEDVLMVQSISIPVEKGFDFELGRVVKKGKGDVTFYSYGIEANSVEIEIAPLYEGFIEEINLLPDENLIPWTGFTDYESDMLYVIKCRDNNFAVIELIEVKVSANEITELEVDYKYQPDGTINFK